MAVHFHYSEIPTETSGQGLTRQRLLTKERVTGTRVLLDRITIEPGAALEIGIAPDSLGWFQLLDGKAHLIGSGADEALSKRHVTFLPLGFRGKLTSPAGATLMLAEVPGAFTYDPAISAKATPLKVVDWRREPVLASEHDARKRIYIATPKLFGTHAVKGEIIIYPPGTAAAEHHHVGADHFMIFLKGRGTTYAEGRPIPVREGDLVYYSDLERHWLQADADSEMMFAEFFVPGVFETIWVEEAIACTWNPTGQDISGEAPVREIARHRHGSADVEI